VSGRGPAGPWSTGSPHHTLPAAARRLCPTNTAKTSRPAGGIGTQGARGLSAQVEAGGGQEVFQRVGLPSTRVAPEAVVDRAPEVIVLAPCGFHVDDVEWEARRVTLFPGWEDLPAVKSGAVWVVDASSYYSRPGPRLVDGMELMARILHPEICGAPDPHRARRVTVPCQRVPGSHAGGVGPEER